MSPVWYKDMEKGPQRIRTLFKKERVNEKAVPMYKNPMYCFMTFVPMDENPHMRIPGTVSAVNAQHQVKK